MQLDRITIAIRPRHHREAMDLGLRLVQAHWRIAYKTWLAFLLPLFVLLCIVFRDTMWVVGFVIWWLKPLYDRILLHVFSRELFDETPHVGDTLRQIPAMFRSGLLWQLTFLRFMPTRSFALPLWQLEGLKGRKRRERSKLLANRARSHAIWLLIICVHMEAFFTLALYGLIYMLLPANLGLDSMLDFFSDTSSYWVEVLTSSLYLLAMLAVEPFYVAGGFLLYINRRTELEAWDIEIGLRRLAQRLQGLKAAALVLLLVGLGALQPGPVLAADAPNERLPAEASRRVIDEILASEEFSTEQTLTLWLPKGWADFDDADESPTLELPSISLWFADSLKLLVILAVLGLLVYFLINHGHLLRGLRRAEKKTPAAPPTHLFGMELQPDTLPDDIGAEARRLWQHGQHRQALGLLYRGSLSRLVNLDHLDLHDSMTEADVMQAVEQARLPAGKIRYLAELTRAWLTLAYGHHRLDEQTVQPLLQQWPLHFGQEAGHEP